MPGYGHKTIKSCGGRVQSETSAHLYKVDGRELAGRQGTLEVSDGGCAEIQHIVKLQ